MRNWTLDQIAWDRFDASKIDLELLRNVKAAAMVERNGADYGVYLSRVFADDPAFVEAVNGWVVEEVQHGMALGRWAQLADPSWDFDAAFAASAPAIACRSMSPVRCAAARPAR